MVAAVRDEFAVLLLLQFTAQLLWERRDRAQRLFLRKSYQELHGVSGALAIYADGVLHSLPPQHLALARAMLLGLVTADGTRRAIKRSQVLRGLGPDAEQVLSRLVDARLISVRRPRGEAS